MKYKIFYSFKGGSDNSKNNSIENVEDLISKINLEEEQNPTEKSVSTPQSISSNKPTSSENNSINETQEESTSTTSSENYSVNEGQDETTSATSSVIPLTYE